MKNDKCKVGRLEKVGNAHGWSFYTFHWRDRLIFVYFIATRTVELLCQVNRQITVVFIHCIVVIMGALVWLYNDRLTRTVTVG